MYGIGILAVEETVDVWSEIIPFLVLIAVTFFTFRAVRWIIAMRKVNKYTDELLDWKEKFDEGLISEKEFEEHRKEIMSR